MLCSVCNPHSPWGSVSRKGTNSEMTTQLVNPLIYISYKPNTFFLISSTQEPPRDLNVLLKGQWGIELMISLINDNYLFDCYLLSKLLCCNKCLTDSLSDRMTFFNPIRQDTTKLFLFTKK